MKSTEPKKDPDQFCVLVGQVLHEARLAKGYTLEEAAVRAGISRQTVQFVESATHSVRLDTYKRLARGLGLRPSWVLSEVESREGGQG